MLYKVLWFAMHYRAISNWMDFSGFSQIKRAFYPNINCISNSINSYFDDFGLEYNGLTRLKTKVKSDHVQA